MKLRLHLLIHFLSAWPIGFLVMMLWDKPLWAFLSSFVGAFLIDIDHLIDYFLAFGFRLKLKNFFHHFQYLKTGKVYIIFHDFELIIALALVALIIHNEVVKSFLTGLSLGMFVHLIIDIALNEIPFRSYWLINRWQDKFEAEKVFTKKGYSKHLKLKKKYLG